MAAALVIGAGRREAGFFQQGLVDDAVEGGAVDRLAADLQQHRHGERRDAVERGGVRCGPWRAPACRRGGARRPGRCAASGAVARSRMWSGSCLRSAS